MQIPRFDILTLFPQALQPYLQASLVGKAVEKGLVRIFVHSLRDFAADKHRCVDDRTYGGGDGMVLKPEPLVAAIETLRASYRRGRVVYLSPQGRLFNQRCIDALKRYDEVLLVCGRYEGIDERVLEGWIDEEVSLGDFVLCGGEIPALAVVEACVRQIPGVLGKVGSLCEESLQGSLLEYAHYTRPAVFRGLAVPEVLRNGNHAAIKTWRRRQTLRRTWLKRPDLLAQCELSPEDRVFLASLETP